MNTLRYQQVVEYGFAVLPNETKDFPIIGGLAYPIIIPFLSFVAYNSATPFTGSQVRTMLYIGYNQPMFSILPNNHGGNIIYMTDNVATPYFLLDTPIYLNSGRYLRMYGSNQSASLNYFLYGMLVYNIV